MSLITDNNDISGMFSKAGRVSLEMFTMLQLKDELFNNKKRVFKSQMNYMDNYSEVMKN